MTEESTKLVRRMYDEAWNEGKLDVVDEICAPDYVGVGPYGDEHGPARQSLRRRWARGS